MSLVNRFRASLNAVKACAALSLLLAAVPAHSQTFTDITVRGDSNIFAAGRTTPTAPGGGGAGTLPPAAVFAGLSGQYIEMTSVTGQVGCCGINNPLTSPDGYVFPTSVNSFDGIAGLIHSNRAQFLTGIFLGDNEPSGVAPARLSFTSSNFTTLSPLLGQTFYIGDGLTGTGTGAVQRFLVPDGATRLFLGIIDAANTEGDHGSYGSNVGAYTASLIVTPVVVPEAGTLALLGFALVPVALGLARSHTGAVRRKSVTVASS